MTRRAHEIIIDERSIRARRVLNQHASASADQNGVIPGNGRPIDDDVIIGSGAHRIVSQGEKIALRFIVGIVEVANGVVAERIGDRSGGGRL